MRFKKTSSLKNGSKFLVFLLAFFPLFFVNVWAQSVSIRLKVVTEQANVRLKPDIGSIIIYQLPQGTIVDSSEKEGEWYRVRLVQDEGDTVSGYVHESLVIEIEKLPQEREAGEKKIERKEVSKVEREEVEPIQPSPVAPTSLKAPFSRFNLFLSGGGNFISGGDLNKGSQGLADYYSDILGIQGKGDIKPLNLSYMFGAEISFSLSNVFSVGIGADYLVR
ncbi:MAG: SH3 domain-containing protein, partial [Acidobacteriota bacterium]|nr:SH3 domain-containing protein [Acidobacteriota bacterium]